MIEGLQRLNDPQSLKSFLEQAQHNDAPPSSHQDDADKIDDEEDLFDILTRRSHKAADKMDVDDWPTTSNKGGNHEDEELELFKKLKPVEGSKSSPNVLDDDWPVTTLPPPTPNEDEWDTFTSVPADDFPKEKSDS